MTNQHRKYATVNHVSGSGRITFSNDGNDFLELGNDLGSNQLILKIPENVPDDEKQAMYEKLAEGIRDANVEIAYDDKSTGKLSGAHSYSVVIPIDPKKPQKQLLPLSEYLEKKSSLSGDREDRVAPIPSRYESANGEAVLSPYVALTDFAEVKQGEPDKLYKAAAAFVKLINDIKKAKGEETGHAASTDGATASFQVRLGR